MKTIFLVTESYCVEGSTPRCLMAFDDKADAERMAKINDWSVQELLLVEADKEKVNFRETVPTSKKIEKSLFVRNDWPQERTVTCEVVE